MNITELKPSAIWGYFHQITQVPRPSKKEEKILAFLKNTYAHMGGFFSYIDSGEKPTSTCAYDDYIGDIFHI